MFPRYIFTRNVKLNDELGHDNLKDIHRFPWTHDTRTYCRPLSSGTVTTRFYKQLGFEHQTFRLRCQRQTH